MEQAFAESGVRTILLRAGDFLDTAPTGNWFDTIIVKNLAKDVFNFPGRTDIPHSWAYLPDYCRAFVQLAEMRSELAVCTSLNFEGYTMSGDQMAAILGVSAKRMNWLPLYLVAPFWKMGRCLLEMKYLWDKPHRMDGAGFHRLVPDFKPTPVNEAVHRAASFQINPNEPVIGARAAV